MLKPERFLGYLSLLLSLVSVITMFVLIGTNNTNYPQEVAILNQNITSVQNNIPATIACQQMIPALYQEYLTCVDAGNFECSTKNSQEINLRTALNNLNATKQQIQDYCTNRTLLLMAQIANFTSNENVTIVQSGSVSVSVTGAPSFNANYVWSRSILKGDLKVDILLLKKWNTAVSTLATNPVITYGTPLGFVRDNGKIPIIYQEVFVGGNVTSRKGVEFYVEGTVNPTLLLSKDISIILQK